jgi:hypothetical protein
MLSIKWVGMDIWAGKRDITYFIRDDAWINMGRCRVTDITCFGVPIKFRKIYGSTDEIRRSLRQASRETVTVKFGIIEMIANGKDLGTFSNYEVVDLVTGAVHTLDDVLSKKI